MKRFAYIFTLFFLLLITTSTTCIEPMTDLQEDPTGIVIENFDFSGTTIEPVVDNRCPRRAYVLGYRGLFHINPAILADNDIIAISNSAIDVRIICNNDYSPEYPAGSDVSQLFAVYRGRYLNYLTSEYTYLAVQEYPEPGVNIFTVIVTLQDGKTFEALTPEVTFI